jgi:hypothetical protein
VRLNHTDGVIREEYVETVNARDASLQEELPQMEDTLVAESEEEQTAPTQSRENSVPTEKGPSFSPRKDPAILSLIVKFKNVGIHRAAIDDKATDLQKRSGEEEVSMERTQDAASIGQGPIQYVRPHTTSVPVARCIRQTSSTSSRATPRKASTSSDDQRPAERSKTSPPVAKKAASKAPIHKLRSSRHPDSIDDDPVEGIVIEGDKSTSATTAVKSHIKSSTAELSELILPTRQIDGEEFSEHPTKRNIVIARFKYKLAGDDTEYEQIDEIPKQRVVSITKKRKVNTRETYLLPDPNVARVDPGKNKGTWEEPKNGSANWTRGSDKWSPTASIRKFDSQTHDYLSYNTLISHLDETIDPNDQGWRQAFNKALDKIRQRHASDYELKVTKLPWAVEECQALYKSINRWCSAKGVDKFSLGTGELDLRLFAADINTDCSALHHRKGSSRTQDMVRSQIRNAINSKSAKYENDPIRVLARRAREMKKSMEEGVNYPREEHFPDEAIPLEDFAEDVEVDREEDMEESVLDEAY